MVYAFAPEWPSGLCISYIFVKHYYVSAIVSFSHITVSPYNVPNSICRHLIYDCKCKNDFVLPEIAVTVMTESCASSAIIKMILLCS